MNLTVDGKTVSTTKVQADSWTDYPTSITIPAGSHTIGLIYTNQGTAFFCIRSLLVDKVTVVESAATTTTTTTTSPTTTTTNPTTTTSTPTPTSPTSVPAARLFNGDYSTGDFSQWLTVQNKYYNGRGVSYQPAYPATIVSDAQKGNAGRFEVRSGDVPPFGGGERSEVQSSEAQTGGTEGQIQVVSVLRPVRPHVPAEPRRPRLGLTNQWHANADGSPPVGWYVDQKNGFWSLTIHKQSSPGIFLATIRIINVPLGTGWHDVKMQVNWSASDTKGYIRLWLNGVRQTFVNGTRRVTTGRPWRPPASCTTPGS